MACLSQALACCRRSSQKRLKNALPESRKALPPHSSGKSSSDPGRAPCGAFCGRSETRPQQKGRPEGQQAQQQGQRRPETRSSREDNAEEAVQRLCHLSCSKASTLAGCVARTEACSAEGTGASRAKCRAARPFTQLHCAEKEAWTLDRQRSARSCFKPSATRAVSSRSTRGSKEANKGM